MKAMLKCTVLSGLLISQFSFGEVPDPGKVGSSVSSPTGCKQDPSTSSSFRCYNASWETPQKVMEHLDYAKFKGNHDGLRYNRNRNNTTPNFENHCSQDMLFNNVQAANRGLWSLKCEYINYERIAAKLLTVDLTTFQPKVIPIVQYPIFGKYNSDGTVLSVYQSINKNLDYRTTPCNLPEKEYHLGWCEAGCFAEDQTLPVVISDIEYELTIADASFESELSVKSLALSSTRDNIKTSIQEAAIPKSNNHLLLGEEVYEIYVSGDQTPALRLSGNHPLLDASGEFVIPAELKIGDKILTVDGPVEISNLIITEFDGDFYNIVPTSKELLHNIIVVGQGFLAGSQRVQRHEYGQIKRDFFRENIIVD